MEKLTFSLLLIGIVAMTGLLNQCNPLFFNRFLGTYHPVAILLLCGMIGYILLSTFLPKLGFIIYKTEHLKEAFRRYAWLIILFALIAILVDCKIVYPRDMNIPFPESMLFYPTMGFLVEILFHILPLSVLLFMLTFLFKRKSSDNILWISLLIVGTIEPTYQVYFMEPYLSWATAVVWINLFLFNTTQLFIFKKYDFITMYLSRLFYYLIWHILWGYFRLELLFN